MTQKTKVWKVEMDLIYQVFFHIKQIQLTLFQSGWMEISDIDSI